MLVVISSMSGAPSARGALNASGFGGSLRPVPPNGAGERSAAVQEQQPDTVLLRGNRGKRAQPSDVSRAMDGDRAECVLFGAVHRHLHRLFRQNDALHLLSVNDK